MLKNKENKNKNAKKAVDDSNDDELVLCLLMLESKKEEVKKKVRFMDNVKVPMEAGVMCTIDGKPSTAHEEHMDWRFQCIVSHYK